MNAPPGQPPAGGPPYQPQPYQQQPPYYAPQGAPIPPQIRKPDETLAIVSLVLAIASWVMGLLILGSIPAVVVGHMARKKIRADPQGFGGDSMATAGLIVGYINIAVTVFVVLIVVASIVLPFCVACVGLLGAAAGG